MASRIAAVLVTMAALMTAGPAAAQSLTGDRLYDFCRGRDVPNQLAESYICISFIRGIIDGARLQAFLTAKQSIPEHLKTLAICEPPGVTPDQAAAVILRYIEAKPETRPLPASVVVFQALGSAWPCTPGASP